jgi:hypothetical protein
MLMLEHNLLKYVNCISKIRLSDYPLLSFDLFGHFLSNHFSWTSVSTISISGFRRDVDEIFALLGYYTASCGNCLPTFRDNVSVPSSLVLGLLTREDGTDMFRNVVNNYHMTPRNTSEDRRL